MIEGLVSFHSVHKSMEAKLEKGYHTEKTHSLTNIRMKKTKTNSSSDKAPNKKNKMDGRGHEDAALSCRFLIAINVFGSAGPLRFIVSGDDSAADVIETALKLYAREGRLPVLGSDTTCFTLYRTNADFIALGSSEAIGSHHVRNFVMCKNQNKPSMTEGRSQIVDVRKASKWCLWLQKSLSLKILFH